ncbi:MAG: Clp protease N-terminal domain-containing protein [Gaiellaceae bacterium]
MARFDPRTFRTVGHHYVGPEHLLLGVARTARRTCRPRPGGARRHPGGRPRSHRRAPPSLGAAAGRLARRRAADKAALELQRTLAKRLGHRCAHTEHVLLAAVSLALKNPAGTVLAE